MINNNKSAHNAVSDRNANAYILCAAFAPSFVLSEASKFRAPCTLLPWCHHGTQPRIYKRGGPGTFRVSLRFPFTPVYSMGICEKDLFKINIFRACSDISVRNVTRDSRLLIVLSVAKAIQFCCLLLEYRFSWGPGYLAAFMKSVLYLTPTLLLM